MEVAAFHGHICPGVALGYKAARAGLSALEVGRAKDEELVALVENDACGVDAVQALTGCTFGKGNLIFLDHGKQVFTFARRDKKEAVRISLRGEADRRRGRRRKRDRSERVLEILGTPVKELFKVTRVRVDLPPKAAIRGSEICARCGEPVMVTRLKEVGGKLVCIPCSEKRRRARRRTKKKGSGLRAKR